MTHLIAEVRDSALTPEGREVFRFVPATLLTQGQTVYYTLRIENPTAAQLGQVSVVQRIPANTIYVPGSAAGPGANVSLSVDGGQTFEPETVRKGSAKNAIGDGRS